MKIIKKIKNQIKKNKILLYMKGSPNFPNCGFSEKAAQAIISCGVRFAYIDVLKHPEIRSELPKFSNWPTFPQLWLQGKLIGGCDIILEMQKSGELKKIINKANENK